LPRFSAYFIGAGNAILPYIKYLITKPTDTGLQKTTGTIKIPEPDLNRMLRLSSAAGCKRSLRTL